MASENQEKLVLEGYRRTENRLIAQAEFAIASDQRALVLATVSIALAAVVAALSDKFGSGPWALGGALFLSVSSFASILAALPQKMKTSGSKYAELAEKIECDRDYINVVAGLALNNDDAIDYNERKAVTRSCLYNIAVLLCSIGIVLTLISIYSENNGGATTSEEQS